MNEHSLSIDIRHHAVRQDVMKGNIIIGGVKTKENRSDIMTKFLPAPTHTKHARYINILFPEPPTPTSTTDKQTYTINTTSFSYRKLRYGRLCRARARGCLASEENKFYHQAQGSIKPTTLHLMRSRQYFHRYHHPSKPKRTNQRNNRHRFIQFIQRHCIGMNTFQNKPGRYTTSDHNHHRPHHDQQASPHSPLTRQQKRKVWLNK
jgi:hypothetical protein